MPSLEISVPLIYDCRAFMALSPCRKESLLFLTMAMAKKFQFCFKFSVLSQNYDEIKSVFAVCSICIVKSSDFIKKGVRGLSHDRLRT